MQIYQRDVRQSRLILRYELLTRSGSSKSGRQMVFSQTVPPWSPPPPQQIWQWLDGTGAIRLIISLSMEMVINGPIIWSWFNWEPPLDGDEVTRWRGRFCQSCFAQPRNRHQERNWVQLTFSAILQHGDLGRDDDKDSWWSYLVDLPQPSLSPKLSPVREHKSSTISSHLACLPWGGEARLGGFQTTSCWAANTQLESQVMKWRADKG